jgi:hypothetical protein
MLSPKQGILGRKHGPIEYCMGDIQTYGTKLEWEAHEIPASREVALGRLVKHSARLAEHDRSIATEILGPRPLDQILLACTATPPNSQALVSLNPPFLRRERSCVVAIRAGDGLGPVCKDKVNEALLQKGFQNFAQLGRMAHTIML